MADLITGLTVKGVRDQLARVHDTIASAGADPEAVAVLAAVKYVAVR